VTTVPALAQIADVSERKCKVIVAYLEHASLVRRARGQVKLLQPSRDRAALDELLDAYEHRHRDDRERLETMMRYAQTAQCRMQFLQEYFDDADAGECGRCDNCLAHARGLAAAGVEQPLA
jgi:ATP-dependent DNA helicase RecQ